MIRVLLVDDHAMLREGIRAHLRASRDIRITGEAASAKEMLKELKRQDFDVIVLDIKLGDATGISLLRKIRRLQPGAKVLILTMYDHAQYATHAMKLGAAGYVVKGAAVDELVTAIRTVHAGKSFVSPSLKRRMAGPVKPARRVYAATTLSPREYEVMAKLARGLTIKEVAALLGVSTKSITTYRARLMDKLNLSNNAEIVRYAIRTNVID